MDSDGDRDHLDFATAVSDRVTVGRSLNAESNGVVATYTVTTNGGADRSVTVRVLDFLPNWGIENIGFHPEFEPEQGAITENKVAFTGEVPPDETLVVKYGATLSASEPVEVVAREQSFSPPRIEEIDAAETDASAAPGADAESGIADEGPQPADAAGTDTGPDVEGPDAATSDAAASQHDASADTDSSKPTPAGDEEADDSADAEGGSIVFENDDSSGVDSETAGEPRSPDGSEAPTEGSDDPPADEGGGTADGPSRPDASTAGGIESGTATSAGQAGDHAGDGVVDALIDEIERGAVSDAQLAALQEALGGGTPPSVDVRLRHVHARLEEFAAYADELQAMIDRGDVDGGSELRADVEALRTDLESVRERQRGHAEQLESIADLATGLEDQVDALTASIEELESQLDSELEGLRERPDPSADGAPDPSEVEQLRTAVNVLAEDTEERFEDLWSTLDALNAKIERASSSGDGVVDATD